MQLCSVSSSSASLDVLLADVLDAAHQKAAGAAGRVEQRLAELGVDLVDHELCDGAWRVELAGIAGILQIREQLLVHLAEFVPIRGPIEVDLVELVDHLPHQRARLHVVVRILEDASNDACEGRILAPDAQLLERLEQLVIRRNRAARRP